MSCLYKLQYAGDVGL